MMTITVPDVLDEIGRVKLLRNRLNDYLGDLKSFQQLLQKQESLTPEEIEKLHWLKTYLPEESDRIKKLT